tara:strand:+ start:3496 stop:5172 length:1677 start_codon:yes stop_codon:yes gene_type:complete
MARINLNVGDNANSGTGDTLRSAMQNVNTMFTELYNSPLFDGDLLFSGNEISATRSNDDIVFVPAGSGSVTLPAIRFNDNNIEGTRTNDNINLLPAGTGSVVFGAIKINGTSLSSDDSTVININDGLIVDGTLNVLSTANTGTLTAGTGSTFGNLTLANGSITDSSGTISFGNENLTTTGTLTAGTGSTFGNLTLANGSITDSSGTISFGNENLTTTGTLTAGTGSSLGNLTLANGSITDSSGTISFGNENLTTTGTLGATGLATLGSLTVPGVTTLSTTNIDNLNFFDNYITTDTNADINLSPGGTGSVIVSSLTVDSNINISDNEITTTQSNSDLVITPSGSGQVVMDKADINGGTIDNTVIGGTTSVAGTFTTLSTTSALTIDGITITDNTVSTNASNSVLELTGNGSGGVNISGFTFPQTDGSSGQFISTDGLGTLSFATAGATLNHSDIADATTTVSSSATTTLNTFDKTVYRSAKYFISVTDATNGRYELVEANVVHDGSTAYITTFGSVSDHGTGLAVYSVSISGDDVRVQVTNISDNSTVFKFQRIAIDI